MQKKLWRSRVVLFRDWEAVHDNSLYPLSGVINKTPGAIKKNSILQALVLLCDHVMRENQDSIACCVNFATHFVLLAEHPTGSIICSGPTPTPTSPYESILQ